jgi:hypothetical protein
MDFKIKHHDFDYVANNIGFIRETTSVSTLTYREDVDFSERDRIISKLQEERKKSNLTKEQSQKIDDICKAYIKDIDDTRNKVIAYSVKGNSASTLTIPNQQLEQSKLRYQEESDKSRKLRFLEDYVLEHKDLSLEDIKMNFGTMFDDEVIKSTYEAVQYNNNRLRNFYSSRLNIDPQESDNYIKHLPKRYLLRENNPESKDIEENGKEIEVIADICDCFGKTKDVFMLDNRSANFEKKKELFDIGYYAVYQRLMFLFDNRNKLNIDFSNPNTIWALSNSCYQFNKNYVRPLYSKETKRYWKEEHDDMYVEYEFMNARYRVPEDYDTLKANINKVKEAIKNKANNNLGER